MAKQGTKAHELAIRDGDRPLQTAVALQCLAAALDMAAQPQPAAMQLCVCDVDWERTQWRKLSLLKDIRGLESQGQAETARPKLEAVVRAQGNPKEQVEAFFVAACEGRKKKLGPCSRKVTQSSGFGLSGNCAGAKLVQSEVQRERAARHSGRFEHGTEEACGRAKQILVCIELLRQSWGR